MPQVYIVLSNFSPPLLRNSEEGVDELAARFIAAVEKRFGIEGLNDTAYTVVQALSTKGEADVQVEVRYTAGEDEYGKGEPFDPDEKTRKALMGDLNEEFSAFLREHRVNPARFNLSTWIIPLRGTTFKMFERMC